MIAVVPNQYGTGSYVQGIDEYTTHDKFELAYLAVLWLTLLGFLFYLIWIGVKVLGKLQLRELKEKRLKHEVKLIQVYAEASSSAVQRERVSADKAAQPEESESDN